MIRARFVFAATLVGASLAAGTASAQAPAAPDFKPILAGKNFQPPIRGAADVEFTQAADQTRQGHGRRRVHGEEHVERADRPADDRVDLLRQGRPR